MKTFLLLLIAIMLTGCISSGVIPMDRNSYMITKRSARLGIGMPFGTQADVYEEANEYCGKSLQVVHTLSLQLEESMPASPGSVTLHFSCVSQ